MSMSVKDSNGSFWTGSLIFIHFQEHKSNINCRSMFKIWNKNHQEHSISLDKRFLLRISCPDRNVNPRSFACVAPHSPGKPTCFWETRPHQPTAGTHASSFLLKLCGFLSVGYGPLHKAHRLVHVAFDSIDHSTLRARIA